MKISINDEGVRKKILTIFLRTFYVKVSVFYERVKNGLPILVNLYNKVTKRIHLW